MTDHSYDRTGDDAVAVTVSEERMRVATVRAPVEVVRITKRVVTETVQIPVELRREELTVTRHRLDVNDVAGSSGGTESSNGVQSAAGEERVFVLHREVPVVSTRIEANEQVTVRVEEVVGEQTVQAELRRERVDIDRDGGPPGSPDRT